MIELRLFYNKLKTNTFLFCSRFESLESQKEALLDVAHECFTAANIAWQANEGEHDERWLHHYMLGKISEKRKQEPAAYLEHYNKAGKLLFENKATYPLKINYNNPQHLSMEALEIHYRIHAAILKYLELHEDKPLSRTVGKIFQKYLKDANNGLFANPLTTPDKTTLKRPAPETETPNIKNRRLSEISNFEEVTNIVEDMLKTLDAEDEELKKQDDDVVMIIDSDDDTTAMNKRLQAYKELAKKSIGVQNDDKSGVSTPSTDSDNKIPKIRVKNAQEIMDDMMKKCMAGQAEYKSETETDAESEVVEKVKEVKMVTENINQVCLF